MSVNKVILLGRLGDNPDIRTMQSGDRVANLSIATSESWKSKDGEKTERTQWHKVVVFAQPLVTLLEEYVIKGDQIYLEGQLETRSWEDQGGVKKYTTEVVLRPFMGKIDLIGGRKDDKPVKEKQEKNNQQNDFIDDDIPF